MSLKQKRNQRTHGIMVQRLLASLIVKKCIESDKNKIRFTVKNNYFSSEPLWCRVWAKEVDSWTIFQELKSKWGFVGRLCTYRYWIDSSGFLQFHTSSVDASGSHTIIWIPISTIGALIHKVWTFWPQTYNYPNLTSFPCWSHWEFGWKIRNKRFKIGASCKFDQSNQTFAV